MYMNQDMFIQNFNAHDLQQLARIKNELSVTGSCLELADIISCSPTSTADQDFMSENNNQLIRHNNFNNQDLLLKTVFSSEESIFNSFDTNSCYKGTFSQIFPTLKISNWNQPSNDFDMNLRALDPSGYPTFNGNFNHQPSPSNDHNLGHLFQEKCVSYDVDQMNSKPLKIEPAFIGESIGVKRAASNDIDAKASKANPTKKSKLESRGSCAPLKVRKEKLGDRILALHQMVAPFGKTDTASVLMEAIGYIKFLQNQVETLSMPYMKSTYKMSRMSTRGGSTKDGNEATKRDLRSRGLCLVPISCLTYVTYGGGSVWATL